MDLLEKEWYIQAPWGRICILAWGNSLDPPVLLCHGSADSAVTFRPLLKLLPKEFYYIGMELPGNGKSDRFPPGMMISVYDMVYAIRAVIKHFRWDSIVLVAHSLGAILGKVYNVVYPGSLSKLVELDPISFMSVTPEEFPQWYEYHFTDFYAKYDTYNSPKENAPALKWEEAVKQIMEKRAMSEENAIATLSRWTEPAGNGLIRYTFDRRTRILTQPPYSPEHIKKIFTNLPTPTLMIVSETTRNMGLYKKTEFLLDETNYKHNNFRMRQVKSGHNVHVNHPEMIAGFISQFLLYGLEGLSDKSKL